MGTERSETWGPTSDLASRNPSCASGSVYQLFLVKLLPTSITFASHNPNTSPETGYVVCVRHCDFQLFWSESTLLEESLSSWFLYASLCQSTRRASLPFLPCCRNISLCACVLFPSPEPCRPLSDWLHLKVPWEAVPNTLFWFLAWLRPSLGAGSNGHTLCGLDLVAWAGTLVAAVYPAGDLFTSQNALFHKINKWRTNGYNTSQIEPFQSCN